MANLSLAHRIQLLFLTKEWTTLVTLFLCTVGRQLAVCRTMANSAQLWAV